MGNEWPRKPLKEVGVSLIDCVHKTPPAAETGHPYIAIPQMKEGCIDFNAAPRLISESDLAEWTQKADPQKDDIVLSRRCNPGETAYVDGSRRFALGQNLVLLRSESDQIFPPFLRWMVRSPFWWGQVGKYLNAGAVFDSLRCADIPKFELPIPPIQDQKTIAHILGTLDDKIELNRQMNATLESMAQALFKSWFVDFDPVIDNALAAGNPIPEPLQAKAEQRKALGDQRKPLPAEIQQLFPDRFVFTEEMGWVPEGWEVKPVYELAEFVNGAAFKAKQFSPDLEGHPVIKIAELKSGITGQTKFTKETIDKKYQVLPGDILFSWSGNPDTSIDTFVWTWSEGWLNQHIFKINLHASSDKSFIYYLLKSLKPVFAAIARDKQTTGLGHVTVKDLKRTFVVLPSPQVLDQFNLIASPIFSQWYGNTLSSNNLAKLRDTLLPKLLSGELRIPDAEKQVAEVC